MSWCVPWVTLGHYPKKEKKKRSSGHLSRTPRRKKRKEKEKDKKMESCQTTPGNSDNSLQLMCLKGMQTSFASPCLLRHLGGSPEHKRLEPPDFQNIRKLLNFRFLQNAQSWQLGTKLLVKTCFHDCIRFSSFVYRTARGRSELKRCIPDLCPPASRQATRNRSCQAQVPSGLSDPSSPSPQTRRSHQPPRRRRADTPREPGASGATA